MAGAARGAQIEIYLEWRRSSSGPVVRNRGGIACAVRNEGRTESLKTCDGPRDHPHAAGGGGIGVMTFMTIDDISNFITSLIAANDGSAMNSPILAMSVA